MMVVFGCLKRSLFCLSGSSFIIFYIRFFREKHVQVLDLTEDSYSDDLQLSPLNFSDHDNMPPVSLPSQSGKILFLDIII